MSESKKQEESTTQSKAVALRYNAEQDAAPVVIASGYGSIADKIIDIAEERGIPVYRDDSAASLLCMLGVGSNIPTELYEVVAAIYAQLLSAAAKMQNEAMPLKATVDKARDKAKNTRNTTGEK